MLIGSFGWTGTDTTTGSVTSEQFNLFAWLASASSPGIAGSYVSGGDSNFRGLHLVVGGVNTSGSVVDTCYSFNKVSWLTTTNMTSVLANNSKSNNDNLFFYAMGGGTTASSNSGQTVVEKFNATGWATTTNISAARSYLCGSNLAGSVYGFGGMDTGGTDKTDVYVLNSVDALSAGTAVPTATRATCASRVNLSTIILWFVGTTSSTNTNYTFNGSAYSSALSGINSKIPNHGGNVGGFVMNSIAVQNGGDAGASALNTTEQYNGFAFSSSVASSLSKAAGAGSVC